MAGIGETEVLPGEKVPKLGTGVMDTGGIDRVVIELEHAHRLTRSILAA